MKLELKQYSSSGFSEQSSYSEHLMKLELKLNH